MFIQTKNSTYQVRAMGNMFEITKIDSSNPDSKFHKVGDVVMSKSISIGIDGSMYFEGTQTSRVVAVHETKG